MIQFDHVSKVYSGGHMALQKVSFQLRSGEMAFLTGHSGAGKSTLLKLHNQKLLIFFHFLHYQPAFHSRKSCYRTQ
jgi:ABC-type ATPase involved in cell division